MYLFHTVLKIKETVLIFVGSLFSVVSLITFGMALKDWQVYLGTKMGKSKNWICA